jgi:hypothetical protein
VPQKKDSDLNIVATGTGGAAGSVGVGAGVGGKKWSSLLVPAVGVAALGLTLAAYTTSRLDDPTAAALITSVLVPVVLSIRKPSSPACVLLPAVDSCNHRGTRPNCEISLTPTNGQFTVTATRPVPSDEETTLCYGARNNDELLQLFGFVERKNEHDRYVIVNAAAKIVQARVLLQLRAQTQGFQASDSQTLETLQASQLSQTFAMTEGEKEVGERFREAHWADALGAATVGAVGAAGAGATAGTGMETLGVVSTMDAVVSAAAPSTWALGSLGSLEALETGDSPASASPDSKLLLRELDCLLELEHTLLRTEAETFLSTFNAQGDQGTQGTVGTVGELRELRELWGIEGTGGIEGIVGTVGSVGAVGTVGAEAERVLRAFFDEKLRVLTEARARIT